MTAGTTALTTDTRVQTSNSKSSEHSSLLVAPESSPWPPYQFGRPRKDTWAAILYVLLVVVAMVFSIVAFFTTDTHAIAGPRFYTNSTSCNLTSYRNSAYPTDVARQTAGTMAAISLIFWVPMTVGAGIVFSLTQLFLFRRYPIRMVWVSSITVVVAGYLVSVAAFIKGNWPFGLGLTVIITAVAVAFWFWRADLILVGELLGITCRGLNECNGILSLSLLVMLFGLGQLILFILGLGYGGFIGVIVPNPDRVSIVANQGDVGLCMDSHGEMIDCCAFQRTTRALVHAIIVATALAWTATNLLQLELYIVSDTMVQWYYQPPGNTDPALKPSVKRAIRNGLTSSFGSICIAGAVLLLVKFLNNLMNAAQGGMQGAWRYVCSCLVCVGQLFTSVIQQFTTFSVVNMAVTGEGFWRSSMLISQTLRRNLLTVFNFWGMPNLILYVIVALATLTWALIIVIIVYLHWSIDYPDKMAIKVAVGVAAICAAVFAFLLMFVTSLMLDGVTAIFVCYLFDLDRKVATRPEILATVEKTPLLAAAAAANAAAAEHSDGTPLLGHAPTGLKSDQQAMSMSR